MNYDFKLHNFGIPIILYGYDFIIIGHWYCHYCCLVNMEWSIRISIGSFIRKRCISSIIRLLLFLDLKLFLESFLKIFHKLDIDLTFPSEIAYQSIHEVDILLQLTFEIRIVLNLLQLLLEHVGELYLGRVFSCVIDQLPVLLGSHGLGLLHCSVKIMLLMEVIINILNFK